MNEAISRIISLKKEDITLKRILAAIIRRISYLPQFFTYYLPFGFYAENRQKMFKFKNIHKGERCFIIANGPSLKKVDFDLLKNEITIGMNRIYLMKNQNGFMPNYLACIDEKSQILQFHEELDLVEINCFFNYKLRGKFSKKQNQHFVLGKFSPKFAVNAPLELFGNGKSVTYTAIQLAFMMGFQEVYLIGKDHSYNTTASAGSGITSDGKEENHFIKGYYKPGQNWDAPDYISEEFAYKLAKKVFEKEKRVIKDATIDGKLNVFEKVNFNDLFN